MIAVVKLGKSKWVVAQLTRGQWLTPLRKRKAGDPTLAYQAGTTRAALAKLVKGNPLVVTYRTRAAAIASVDRPWDGSPMSLAYYDLGTTDA